MSLRVRVILSISFFLIVFSTAFSFDDGRPTPYTLVYDTSYFPAPLIPADNPLTVEGVELGRLLFYDAILSVNNTQSCSSCHKQANSFTDGKKNSIGALGLEGNVNTMPLVNLAWQTEFFWDGRVKSLELQVVEPIQKHNEMALDLDTMALKLLQHPYYPTLFKKAFPSAKNYVTIANVSKALAQFMRTIYISPNPLKGGGFYLYDGEHVSDSIMNTPRYKAFENMSNMCSDCHSSDLYGNKSGELLTNGITFYDNDSTNDKQKFKVPTLVNLAYTAPYMHDGRFATLFEVLDHYDEHIEELHLHNPGVISEKIVNEFSKDDKKEMVAFLLSITDTTILTSKKYANPFASNNFRWEDYPYFK